MSDHFQAEFASGILVNECITETVAFVLGNAIHVMQKLHVAGPLLDFAAREHSLLSRNHDIRWQGGHLAEESSVVNETRNVAGYEPVHHAACADDLASKYAGIDGRLAIVAHDATQELHSSC